MDPIKEAFFNVKKDIGLLNQELKVLKKEVGEIRQEILKLVNILGELTEKALKNHQKTQEKHLQTPSTTPAHQHINQTFPAHNPAHFLPLKPLKPQNSWFSTGNEGVPADRQTNQQTDTSSQIHLQKHPQQHSFQQNTIYSPQRRNSIEDAARILDSLDNLKKEIRLKFKQLTEQETLIFSTLYQLEEEQGQVDYKTLAARLGLTESSIRDYIARLLKKDIPIEKKRINNKQIQLSVSQNLKKIASLSTILQLRGL